MENIEKNNYPIVLKLYKNENLISKRNNNLELLFALKGSGILNINNKKYEFNNGEIILINNLDSYELTDLIGIVAKIIIKRDKLDLDDDILNSNFYCNSLEYSNKTIFIDLKKKCYSLIKDFYSNNFTNIKALAYSYDILNELIINFPKTNNNKTEYNNKMDMILNYIEDNYQNDLSLNEIAERFSFSIPYLSNLFKKELNLNFTEYYDRVRLKHCLDDLLKTNLPIIDIALKNGFASNHAFLRAYKKQYNELPSDTRKRKEITDKPNNIADLEERPITDMLLDLENINQSAINDIFYEDIYINSYSEQKTLFKIVDKPATNSISISNAMNLVYETPRKTLLTIKKILNIKYVTLLGLFSDSMYFCSRDRSNNLQFRYNLIDEALDFLVNNDLIPVISLTFMPSVLAKNKNKTIFADEYITSSPNKISEWKILITNFFTHIIERYGLTKVLSWMFVPWRQPESGINSMGFETDEDFLEFYKETFKTIKDINQNFIISSPEMMPITKRRYEWFTNFLIFMKNNKCLADYLSLEYYADSNWEIIDTYSIKGKNFKSIPYVKPNPDQSSMHNFLISVNNTLKQLEINIPIYISQYGMTISHYNILHDTLYIANYLTKNVIENFEYAKKFTYYRLSDFQATAVDFNLFDGGTGLFYKNLIPKPSLLALKLISKLLDNVISKGSNHILTVNEDRNKLMLLIHNYEHPNDTLIDDNIINLPLFDRYSPFVNKLKKKIHFNYRTIYKKATIQIYSLNKEHGSPYDKWLEAGKPKINSKIEKYSPIYELLKNATHPDYKYEEKLISQNTLSLEIEIKPLEIKLIEIDLTKE